MDNTYENLNQYLNSFFLYYNYPLYTDYLSEFLDLSILSNQMIHNNIKNWDLVEKSFDSNFSLSLCESLDLCSDFIKTYLGDYYDTWKEYLTNGVIDFTDLEQIILEGDSPQLSFSLTGKDSCRFIRSIGVELRHDYLDPATIIHEFVHQLNVDESSFGMHNEILKVSESLFGEVESIYFETLMYRFMEERGYSKEAIASVQFSRISNFSKMCFDSIGELLLLRDYHIFGEISDNNWDEAKKLHILSFDTKMRYHDIATGVDQKIGAQEEEIKVYLGSDFNFFRSFIYVLGTTLAYWAISQNDRNMPWKMLQFNEDLAEDRDLEYSFSRLGLKFDNLYCFVSDAFMEITRCSKNLNYSSKKKK